MASTILDPVGTLIASVISGLSVTPTVKAYWPDPGYAGLDAVPAGVVGSPGIDRQDVQERESQLGTNDWTITYPVSFFFDLGDTATAQAQATQTVEAFIKAIDTATLSVSDATIEDAKVVSATPDEIADSARPMLVYDCRVVVFKLVT